MAKSSFGQLPRSRTIREKDDTQPIVDYDDVDYVDRIDPISTSTTTTSSPQRNPIRNSFISNRRGFNSGAGFGQRVGSTGGRLTIAKSSMETRTEMIETRNPPPLIVANNNRGILARRRKPISRANQQSPTNENNNPTSVSVSPTRSLENSNLDNHSNQPKTSNEDQSSIVMNRQRSFNDQRRSSSSSSFSISNQNNRGPRGRGRAFQLTTATTTTTTSSPRSNINLLPSQRLRLNRKYSRNRFSQFNNQNRHNSHNNNNNINNNNNNNTPYHRQQHHRNLSNQRSSDLQSSSHDQIRKFGRSGLIGRNVGHHFRNQVLQPSVAASISQPEINYPTETIPKVPITITSIATTVKTVPIFHGFRTSYATLTTTTLNTSVIGSTQYELSILEDGITKTLFTKMTDLIEPNKVTEIIVTTSSLQEVKLVPIKFGYSTRTETLTDIKTFTMLSTVVKTNPIGLFSSLAPTIHGALSLITTSYVTTHTLSSTTSVSLLLHGKTLVSTLTFTSVAEETVTKTLTVPANSEDQSQSVSNPQASPLVTMLTLSIRGENGEVTELITAITVPIQAPIAPTIVATKVERDIRPTEHPSSIRDDGYDENREHQFDDDDVDDDYGPIVLETSIDNNNNKYNNNKNNHFNVQNSNFNANNFNYFQSRMDRDPKRNPPNLLISTSFKAIDSQLISQESNLHPNLFITTIFKGPNTEIYEANALLIDQDQSSNSDSKENNDIGGERGQNRFGTRDTLFRKRRLLQFTDNLYKESTNENRAPVERSNKVNKKFQRIRIKQSKPSSASSSTSPNDFHRLVGLSENPASFSSIDAINSFRRQPVLVDQSQFNLYSSVVMSIPTVSSSASYLLANNFQKPTYRKIKPNPNQSRRLVSSARGASIEPSHVLTSGFLLGPTTKTTFIEVPNHFNHHLQQPSSYQQLSSPLGLHHNSNKRVIQHANRAILPHRNPINHFNVPNSLDDQLNPLTYQPMIIYDTGSLPTYPQPIENEFDIANQNHLASMRYSRVRPTSVTSVATPETSTIHTPTIPLTYYTTFTYLTTVIRGQHTAHLSRESVTSAITTKALDKSIVEMVRDNDGIIEPTRLQELGTKTKGLATTIYNALYQVQIYNEDLYKVIQKTYNKEVSFKRWKPTTTAYQPVFVTNHVDFPKESPLLSTIEATPTISENEFDLIRKTHSVLDSSRIVPSFVVDEDNLSSSASYHSSMLISPSIADLLSYTTENLATQSTPTIELTSSSSSSSSSSILLSSASDVNVRQSIRISSSMVRKPFTPRYTHPISRSRIRMRVSSRTSQIPIESTSILEEISSSPTLNVPVSSSISVYEPISSPVLLEPSSTTAESTEHSTTMDSTESLQSLSSQPLSSQSTPTRPNIYRSRVVLRTRPGQSLLTGQSKMIRISSRLIRPSSQDVPLHTPTLETTSLTPEQSDHSARANKFVRVSNGVTLIMSSKVATPTRPLTLKPTLVTGAAVMMKNIMPGNYQNELGDSKSIDRENESSKENAAIDRSFSTIETSQFLRTSTLLSTMTYYATLFNGSTSSITPIEDIKTEYITFPDTTVITRTLKPLIIDTSASIDSDRYDAIRTDRLSTIPKLMSTSSKAISTTTKSTYTTLTHYITLFHGSHTILSSIEEISPTVVTEYIGQSQTDTIGLKPSILNSEDFTTTPNIRFTQQSIDLVQQSKNLYGKLMPSVSTLFTTHTYFTTLFSGTTSIIQSREETTHSLITLYVPSSQTTPSSSKTMISTIEPTSSLKGVNSFTSTESVAMQPSLHGSLADGNLQTSSTDSSHSLSTTSTMSDSTDAVVYFTNFILPSSRPDSENTIDGAKGPLLNHADLTLIGDRPQLSTILENGIIQSSRPVFDQHLPIQTQSPTIKPGAIIELTDLLDGANLAGNIGEAIKDIVQIFAKGQKNSNILKNPTMETDIDRTSLVGEELSPPKDGATVSQLETPIYIPIHEDRSTHIPINSSPVLIIPNEVSKSIDFDTESINLDNLMIPPVAYMPSPMLTKIYYPSSSAPIQPDDSGPSIWINPSFTVEPVFDSTMKSHTNTFDQTLEPIFTTTMTTATTRPSLMVGQSNIVEVSVAHQPESTVVVARKESELTTKYITKVDSYPETTVMTTTKVFSSSTLDSRPMLIF